MNIYNIEDEKFVLNNLFNEFMNENEAIGYLEIRAYSLNEALPVSGLNVKVFTEYKGNIIVFFEGETDSSGMIRKLSLPTPKITKSDLETPEKRVYEIEINYPKFEISKKYEVNIYEGICVVQSINIEPSINIERKKLWL